jgi:hypothetical protein
VKVKQAILLEETEGLLVGGSGSLKKGFQILPRVSPHAIVASGMLLGDEKINDLHLDSILLLLTES